jgi:cell wall-associated NlpC family hydrolase
VALTAGLVSYSVAVSASPKPTISQVTAQVSKLTTAENKAIQQYDQVKVQLTDANSRLKLVNTEVTRDRKQFSLMRSYVAQVAATAYEDGNMTSMAALITSAKPQTILSRASMLVQLSSARSQEMRQFIAAARQLSGAQQSAERTLQTIAALNSQAKAKAAAIGKALNQRKSLLATLTAQQAAAVLTTASPGSPGPTTPPPTNNVPTNTNAGQAVAFAYAQIGCPYVYGATGPCNNGYDCSGLVMAAWASAGVSIPRDTYGQWAALPHVPLSQIQPGDLIYFAGVSHVGMYVGGGYIIDAPVPGQSVEKVALSGWYASSEVGAARP